MAKLNRKLKMGMTGGGIGAFIGEVHRKAARMDGQIEVAAGAFDINPENSKKMGEMLYIDAARAYSDYREMIEKELKLPEGERCDFVSITAPNKWHFPMAKDFLEAGFHVVCEKPMTFDLDEARELVKIVEKTGKVFAVTYTYTAFPMAKLARDLVKAGELGKIRKIVVQYPQGWLATKLEDTGAMQATWRTDPKQSGAAGCVGDIGTHAAHLAEYVSGLDITHICADLTTYVEGRPLDDDANILFRFEDGAKGILHTSQIAIGEENDIAIWVYGEKGGLEWHAEHPNYLYQYKIDQPIHTWRRGNDYVAAASPAAGRCTRLPFGHPEAFFEAFANIYSNVADTIRAKLEGVEPDPLALDFADVNEGLKGMLFINTVLESARATEKWTPMMK